MLIPGMEFFRILTVDICSNRDLNNTLKTVKILLTAVTQTGPAETQDANI